MSDGPPTLDYRHAPNPAAEDYRILAFLAGGALAFASIVVVALVMTFSAVSLHATPAPLPRGVAVGIGGTFVVLLNGLAFVAYRVWRFRSFAVGIWFGSAIALMIEGACFAVGI